MAWRQRAVFAAFVVIAPITSLTAQQSFVTAQQSFATTQQSMFRIDHDDVLIRGCVRPADPRAYTAGDMLAWGHGNVMLTAITGLTPVSPLGNDLPYAVGTSGFVNRVFYWLDDDDDLAQYLGQMVEVRGELKDFERGEFEIDRHGDYTKIKLDLHGRKDTIRLPTSWLIGAGMDRDQDIDIVASRIDVDDVLVLGVCN